PTEELGEEILCQLVLLREWGTAIAIEDLEKGITTKMTGMSILDLRQDPAASTTEPRQGQ
ncbi:hypothetical protein K443DRAFT_682521, partial [Laccaria amethystina LaAM-08-1]